MEIYKSKTPPGKLNKKSLELKTETNFSEPKLLSSLKGFEFEYSEKRGVLYIFPKNKSGKHKLRWLSIHKEDIPDLINTINSFLNK